MQINLFMWGYFKFNHRWGLGWKIFLLFLVFSPSSSNVKLSTSESCSSSRCQRWQVFYEQTKKARVCVHFAFSSSRLKKKIIIFAELQVTAYF